MLVYEDAQHTVYAWNGVDVLVDGQLQHGEVVDVAEGGLIIDFRCAGQRAHFAEFGEIFARRHGQPWTPQHMQVLLPRARDGAWLWCPGEVVELEPFESEGVLFVEVQLPHGVVRELLPVSNCPLPAAYWTNTSQVLKKMFKCALKYRCQVLRTSVLSQTMLYLQRQTAAPLTAEQVERTYAWAKKKTETDHPSLTLDYVLREISLDNARKQRKTSARSAVLALPIELLVEVFQSLDCSRRVRCRRVCALWNSILTTETYFPDIHIDGWSSEYPDFPFMRDMWLVTCLLKCLTTATTTLVLSGMGLVDCRKLSAVVRHLRGSHRLPTLVLFQACFSIFDTEDYMYGQIDVVFEHMVERLTSLAEDFAADRRMVWKQCRVISFLEAVVEQHVFNVQSREEMAVQVWEVFEKGLLLQRPLDRLAVKERIAACIAEHNDAEIEDVVKTVNNYQSPDPRPGTVHRGRLWTAADIGQLDVGQLSVLTVANLTVSETLGSPLPAAWSPQRYPDTGPYFD